MALVFVYGVAEYSSTVGSGPYQLDGALKGNFRFADRMADGDSCWYWATNDAESEFGVGQFFSPNLLVRSEILWSNNVDLAVPWLQGGRRTVRMIPAHLDGLAMVTLFLPGPPIASQSIRIATTDDLSFPAGFSASVAKARVASTGAAVIDVNRITGAGSTALGTITFTAAASGVWAGAGGNLPAGDLIEFLFPAIEDATLADVSLTARGVRT